MDNKFSCVIISNICVFSRFIIVFLNYHRCIIHYCKNNVLRHIRTRGRSANFVECNAY